MREAAPNQQTDTNERPFGRFLLSQVTEADRERLWHRGAYAYARNFAKDYHDQLRPEGSNFITAAEIGEHGEITIPFGVPSYSKAVWLEFEQTQSELDTYTWRVNNSGEEFDMDLSKDGCTVTRYELNDQGNVLRRSIVTDLSIMEGLQTMIEAIVIEAKIEEKITQHREDCQRDLEAYELLNSQARLSWKQQKEKTALKRRGSETLFHAGSIGHRDKLPLI